MDSPSEALHPEMGWQPEKEIVEGRAAGRAMLGLHAVALAHRISADWSFGIHPEVESGGWIGGACGITPVYKCTTGNL